MRVVIAEDLALLRDGLIRLLRDTGFEVVAAVDHPDRFLEAVEEHRPDVCVVDVRLPPTFNDEGVRAALEARRRIPGLPILILSQYVEPLYAHELLATGSEGVGYILKERVSDGAEFIATIQRVGRCSPQFVMRGASSSSSVRSSPMWPTSWRGTPPARGSPRRRSGSGSAAGGA